MNCELLEVLFAFGIAAEYDGGVRVLPLIVHRDRQIRRDFALLDGFQPADRAFVAILTQAQFRAGVARLM
jgi:hypothetical protein